MDLTGAKKEDYWQNNW